MPARTTTKQSKYCIIGHIDTWYGTGRDLLPVQEVQYYGNITSGYWCLILVAVLEVRSNML